jgi:hypothetical protein
MDANIEDKFKGFFAYVCPYGAMLACHKIF